MKADRWVVLTCVLLGLGIYLTLKPALKSVTVQCRTTKGPLEIVVMPEWSPLGAERFLKLVDDGFYTKLPLFRCIDHFICQFGAVPPRELTNYPVIADDPRVAKLRDFKAGFVSFAGSGPNSRAKHVFIALDAVPSLGTQPWETPFGYVSPESLQKTIAKFTTKYGEGPDPRKIEAPGGAEYLHKEFPELDSFISCSRARK